MKRDDDFLSSPLFLPVKILSYSLLSLFVISFSSRAVEGVCVYGERAVPRFVNRAEWARWFFADFSLFFFIFPSSIPFHRRAGLIIMGRGQQCVHAWERGKKYFLFGNSYSNLFWQLTEKRKKPWEKREKNLFSPAFLGVPFPPAQKSPFSLVQIHSFRARHKWASFLSLSIFVALGVRKGEKSGVKSQGDLEALSFSLSGLIWSACEAHTHCMSLVVCIRGSQALAVVVRTTHNMADGSSSATLSFT